MKIDGVAYRSIWPAEDGRSVEIIDQTLLPHRVEHRRLATLEQAVEAIVVMRVRGAPLIGATAAYGIWLAMQADASDAALADASERLIAARPTAVNLRWAVERLRQALIGLSPERRAEAARSLADEIAEEDVAINRAIGENGLELLRSAWEKKGRKGRLNILTHCNAGWIATVDWGTALAPIYLAHDAGIPVHVWVDETRPRNQGASLTAWELGSHGVPHSLIVDNAGGLLMRRGEVDLCIVGTDRVSARGDVCNKIGTYLKALAAKDTGIPFYVALPGPTIDWTLDDGDAIPIEERAEEEVTEVVGLDAQGAVSKVRIAPAGTRATNYGFDVTPARLVTALITERGVAQASREGLAGLYPELAAAAQ